MQAELKILVIIFLAVCSYAKLMFHQPPIRQPKKHIAAQQPPKTSPPLILPFEQTSQQYILTPSVIKQFQKEQAMLAQNSKHLQKSLDVTEQAEEEGELGDKYEKCITGKACQKDQGSYRVINKDEQSLGVFPNTKSTRPKTNQQHWVSLQPLSMPVPSISSRKLNIPSFSAAKLFTFNPKPINDPPSNTYNTFSFNFNLDREAMLNEDSEDEESQENSRGNGHTHKNKAINKHRINNREKMMANRQALFRPSRKIQTKETLKRQEGVKRQEKVMLCLQEQIQKRERELELLKSLLPL